MALTKSDLDRMPCDICGNSGCTDHGGSGWLHSRCHIEVPTWVKYSDGKITIVCAQCERVVCEIQVADPTAKEIWNPQEQRAILEGILKLEMLARDE